MARNRKGGEDLFFGEKEGENLFLKKLKWAENFFHKNGGLDICSVCLSLLVYQG